MTENRGAGRPPLPESEKRIQVQLSIHPDELARLDSLIAAGRFKNRSDFVRQMLERIATEDAGMVTVFVTEDELETLKALGLRLNR